MGVVATELNSLTRMMKYSGKTFSGTVIFISSASRVLTLSWSPVCTPVKTVLPW